jgi:signal transduction histidine kinase
MFRLNFYAIPPFVAAILIISLGIFVFTKNRKSITNLAWLFVCLPFFVWLSGDALLFSTTNTKLGDFFSRYIYCSITAIPVTFYCFAAKIANVVLSNRIKFLFGLYYLVCFTLLVKTDWIITSVHPYFWGFYPLAGKLHGLYLFFWAMIYLSTLHLLYKKMNCKTETEETRRRLTYVFLAFATGGLLGPQDFIQNYGFEFYPFGYFCVPVIIGFVSYAILRHNLLDIKVVIKKWVIYSVFVTILTAIYLLLIVLSEWLFRGIIGYKSIFLSMTSALVIALLFNPLRNRIQTVIDKIFLGKAPREIVEENTLLKHELECSERLKVASRLALGLAHEVKNPLTTIKTFAEYLPEKYTDEDFVKKFSKIVPYEVERINNIVSSLLKFSKPTAPQLKDVDLHHLIQEISIFLNSELLKRQILLKENNENDRISINVDPEQIKQVILNILLNSMDAMPHGGTVTIGTRCNDNSVEISIQDTGCGIAKEDLGHIFEPFYSKKEGGTGLGLAVTHQIIKNHKGDISVASEPGKGTTFSITLPILIA